MYLMYSDVLCSVILFEPFLVSVKQGIDLTFGLKQSRICTLNRIGLDIIEVLLVCLQMEGVSD